MSTLVSLKKVWKSIKSGPLGIASDIYGILETIKDFVSIFGIVISFTGVFGIDFGGRDNLPFFQNYSIPTKAILITISAASIGWGFATITSWLAKQNGELHNIIGHVFGIACASLLVSSAQNLFGIKAGGSEGLVHIFLLIAIVILFVFARAKYRSLYYQDIDIMTQNSGFLLTLSSFIFLLYIVLVFFK